MIYSNGLKIPKSPALKGLMRHLGMFFFLLQSGILKVSHMKHLIFTVHASRLRVEKPHQSYQYQPHQMGGICLHSMWKIQKFQYMLKGHIISTFFSESALFTLASFHHFSGILFACSIENKIRGEMQNTRSFGQSFHD